MDSCFDFSYYRLDTNETHRSKHRDFFWVQLCICWDLPHHSPWQNS